MRLCFGISGLTPKSTRSRRRPLPKSRILNYFSTLDFVDGHQLALLVGLIAALLPAIQAYRTDIAALLASRA